QACGTQPAKTWAGGAARCVTSGRLWVSLGLRVRESLNPPPHQEVKGGWSQVFIFYFRHKGLEGEPAVDTGSHCAGSRLPGRPGASRVWACEQRPGSSWPEAQAGSRSPTLLQVLSLRRLPPRLCGQMGRVPSAVGTTVRAPALQGEHVQVPGRQHARVILPLVLCDLGQATAPLCASVSLPARRSLVLTCIQQAQEAARSRGPSWPLCSLLSPCPLGSVFFSPPQRHSSLWVPAGSCHGGITDPGCPLGARQRGERPQEALGGRGSAHSGAAADFLRAPGLRSWVAARGSGGAGRACGQAGPT
ncbi:hypothetical protein H1C71_018457, partial [Ictidomys tridecemlineatus]